MVQYSTVQYSTVQCSQQYTILTQYAHSTYIYTVDLAFVLWLLKMHLCHRMME